MLRYALIADPDAVRAALYTAIVSQQGVHAATVRDGAAATALMLDRGPPALAIVDLSLERVDGFELIERLRRTATAQVAAVLAVSARRDMRDSATALRTRLGIGAILAKAASEESVRRVIRRLLGEAGVGVPEEPPPPSQEIQGADSAVRRRPGPEVVSEVRARTFWKAGGSR